MSSGIPIKEYYEFCNFLKEITGIQLGDNKQYLVSSRLTQLMRTHNLQSISELLRQIQTSSGRPLLQKVIDAMTTNETNWFRDGYPFTILFNKLLPQLKPHARARIWCAACSSGQEPYSISMAHEEEMNKVNGYKGSIDIVATDLSESILNKAKFAEFDELSAVRGLSEQRRNTFFEFATSGLYRLKPKIKQKVRFQQLNLKDTYTTVGKFDVIFCRNVLIYFPTELKVAILEKLANSLNAKGFLFLGASESANGLSDRFEMIRCNPGIVYQLK